MYTRLIDNTAIERSSNTALTHIIISVQNKIEIGLLHSYTNLASARVGQITSSKHIPMY